LKILERYWQEDNAAAAAFESLKAARFNYRQRDFDHLMNNLVLCLNDLSSTSNPKLLDELRNELRGFQKDAFSAAPLVALANEYRAGGGRVLSRQEILDEVSERRGAPRNPRG